MPLQGIHSASHISDASHSDLPSTRKNNRQTFFDNMRDAAARGFDNQQKLEDIKSVTFDAMRNSPHRPKAQTDEQLKEQVGHFVDRELCRTVDAELTRAITPAEREQLQDLQKDGAHVASMVRDNISALTGQGSSALSRLAQQVASAINPKNLLMLLPALPMVVAAECPDTHGHQRLAVDFMKRLREALGYINHLSEVERIGINSNFHMNGTKLPEDQRTAYIFQMHKGEGMVLNGPLASTNYSRAGGYIQSQHMASMPFARNTGDCETAAMLDQVTPPAYPAQIEKMRMMWDALCCNVQTGAASMLDYVQQNPHLLMDFREHVELPDTQRSGALPTVPAGLMTASPATPASTFPAGNFALGMAAGAATVGVIFAAKAAYNFLHARYIQSSPQAEQSGQRQAMLQPVGNRGLYLDTSIL